MQWIITVGMPGMAGRYQRNNVNRSMASVCGLCCAPAETLDVFQLLFVVFTYRNFKMADNHNVAHLVSTYFHLGLAYSEILAGIACQLGIIISKRTLHRILRSGYLYRRKHKSNIVDVCLFITEQLSEYGSLHGYRWMHASCVRQGYVISREEVRLILSVLDAAGVNIRKRRKLRRRQYHSKGPNSTWHMDGYDKLKPYGLCISGAIDGFSRKLIWLKTYCTNNNPKVIAGYYLEAMKEIGGVPAVVRADCGTENGIVEVIQRSLVPGNSFRYGRSTTNQRIECWWSFLRRQCIQYWMDIMEDIRDQGLFSGDVLDKSLVQYCFTDILQVKLCSLSQLFKNIQHWVPL